MCELVRVRLPNVSNGSRKQIGKLIDKLSPEKCGDNSKEVVDLAREVANEPLFYKNAIQLLGVMDSPQTTDALIDMLERSRSDRSLFEWTPPRALGVKGKKIRQDVKEYLTELKPDSTHIAAVIRKALDDAAKR